MSSVLITGVAGYLGSFLARELISNGYNIIGIDNFEYDNQFSIKDLINISHFKLIKSDIRDQKTIESLSEEEIDVVVNLAAIVGDPACGLRPEMAVKVNYDATIALAEAFLEKDLGLFLFSSTCSVYGKTNLPYATEETALKPVSLYGWTKVLAERGLKRLEEKGLPSCILRFATAYGLSPRPRFDLVVNYFALKAILDGEITVFGGKQFRPFIHVQDISHVLLLCINNPKKVKGEVFNIGNERENYNIAQLADIVKKLIPSIRINTLPEIRDERSYRVSFAKMIERLNYKTTMTVEDAVREIREAVTSGRIKDPYSRVYYNSY